MRSDFAAFIISHGRPTSVITLDTLRKRGYTGRVVFLVDDMDKTLPQYEAEFGKENVVVFDKREVAKRIDIADNFSDMRSPVYARNASFDIARELGIDYFVQLDDDYTDFRFTGIEKGFERKRITNLDRIFEITVEYLASTPAISSIAFCQGGDFIGGEGSPFAQWIRTKRKAMNSFFCVTDRPFPFLGRVNDDVSTYTRLGSIGRIFMTTYQIQLDQLPTQSNPGGMTELYLEQGTYIKSFYSVMMQPSSVSIHVLRDRLRPRVHHRVDWNCTAPKIVRKAIRDASV